jgi:TRAP-type mannitol/chloroaromatic compound transport system substrate-binding protein
MHRLAEGEALQIAALAALQEKGTTFHRLPPEVLEALNAAWLEVASEIAASSENFKRVWESFSAFRDSYKVWNDLGYL